MKKLLLSAVAVALFVTSADGSIFQTKSSKSDVNKTLKEGMGNYYKGMISFVHSMLVGWADAFSYAAKAPAFKDQKTQLNNASKKLKTIAKLTESILKRDRMKDITKKGSSASAALSEFQTAVNSLIGTEYWKHCGAQLRFSIVAISNALKSLVYPSVEFDVGGIIYSANQGLIDANGDSVENDLIANRFSSGGQPASQTSLVIELANGFNNLANAMPKVNELQPISNIVPQQQTVNNVVVPTTNVVPQQQTVNNVVVPTTSVVPQKQTVNNAVVPTTNVVPQQQTVNNAIVPTTNNVLQNNSVSASSTSLKSSTSSSSINSTNSNKRKRR